MSALPAAPDFDASDYERPRRPTVRGVVRLERATVLVELHHDATAPAGWIASGLVECSSDIFGSSIPLRFKAATPKEAWAALSSEVYRQLGVFR